jgi:hypothetical protein
MADEGRWRDLIETQLNKTVGQRAGMEEICQCQEQPCGGWLVVKGIFTEEAQAGRGASNNGQAIQQHRQ